MANWVADFLTRNPDMAALPIALRAKHSIHFKRLDGQIEANFTGAPCHFLDSDGLWKPLDTKLLAIGSEYGAPGLRARLSKNGLARIEGGTYSHRSTRIGIFNPTTKAFSTIKTIPNGLISGDQIIAESGVWKRVLTLTETGLREEIVISALPTGTGAGAGDWLVLETAITGVSFPDGWLDGFSADGFMFPPPRTVDANRNEAPCKRYARTVGGVQYIYTGVPVSWLETAVYPVTIDPDFTASTADGYVFGNAVTYATARLTSFTYSSVATTSYVGQYYQWYYDYRIYLKFITSTIPDGATITQNNLKMTCVTDESNTDFDVQIVKQDWSAQDPLSDANREAAYDNCLAGTADASIWLNTANISLNNQQASGNLSTQWVRDQTDAHDATYYSLRSSRALNADTPTGPERISLGTQNHATAAYRPILTVVYTTGPAIPVLMAQYRQRVT